MVLVDGSEAFLQSLKKLHVGEKVVLENERQVMCTRRQGLVLSKAQMVNVSVTRACETRLYQAMDCAAVLEHMSAAVLEHMSAAVWSPHSRQPRDGKEPGFGQRVSWVCISSSHRSRVVRR